MRWLGEMTSHCIPPSSSLLYIGRWDSNQVTALHSHHHTPLSHLHSHNNNPHSASNPLIPWTTCFQQRVSLHLLTFNVGKSLLKGVWWRNWMILEISHNSDNTCPYTPPARPVIKSYFYKIVVIFLSLWFLLESSWNCDNFHTAGPTLHPQITWWSSSALIRHGEGSGFEENILPEIIKILHIPWESMYYVLSKYWSGVFLTCTLHLWRKHSQWQS